MAVSLTPLLVRARNAGLSLRTRDGYVVVRPKELLTPELRTDLARHKPELLELLAWDKERAYTLIKDALAYLAEAYFKAGSPNFDLEALEEPEDRIDHACAREDMLALRIAVRAWVLVALQAFEAHTPKDKVTV